MDDSNQVIMTLTVKNIDKNAKFSKNYFELDQSYLQNDSKKDTTNSKDKVDTKQTSKLSDESVYPMYVPTDTYLSSQDVVKTDDGERVIMTFAGENPFTLVQENANIKNTDYISGDPCLISNTVGAIMDDAVMWVSNNIEYYVASDVMSVDELLTVAESINVITVGK